ncbi:nucleoside-diphosphate kinase [Candidatus Woesearchaeota archaeon]|nr:nucleoside-diphosphate kinase [Candidatus Woesearchaeota archaeon]
MIERTLVLIKPDGILRGLVGEIIKRFEQRGLKVVGLKMVWIDKSFAKKHYAAHIEKDFYKGLEEFITSAPLVAIAIEGIHAVEYVRKIVGATEPKSAELGTIRGDFAHTSYKYSDSKGITIKNLVHASGSVEEAKKEVALWFTPTEIHTYKISQEKEIF